MGSGTTIFECETLERKNIGFDINPKIVEYVRQKMLDDSVLNKFFIEECNSLDSEKVCNAFGKSEAKNVQFILMHPPYPDIVKFTDNPDDLSQIGNLKEFIGKFRTMCENSLKYLNKNIYRTYAVGRSR